MHNLQFDYASVDKSPPTHNGCGDFLHFYPHKKENEMNAKPVGYKKTFFLLFVLLLTACVAPATPGGFLHTG